MKTQLMTVGSFLLGYSLVLTAGNAEMMQQNTEQLIKLNNTLIKQLSHVNPNEKIQLEATITTKPDGNQVIIIHHVDRQQSKDDDTLNSPEQYKTFVRSGEVLVDNEIKKTKSTLKISTHKQNSLMGKALKPISANNIKVQ